MKQSEFNVRGENIEILKRNYEKLKKKKKGRIRSNIHLTDIQKERREQRNNASKDEG